MLPLKITHQKADPKKTPAIQFINLLHEAGLLSVPAGPRVIRLLPPLNITQTEASEAVRIIETVAERLSV